MTKGINKLYYSFKEIIAIYAEALENETGEPVENLEAVMDFDNYKIDFDANDDKTVIKICGAFIQFEMNDTDVSVVNYMDGSGWYIGY